MNYDKEIYDDALQAVVNEIDKRIEPREGGSIK